MIRLLILGLIAECSASGAGNSNEPGVGVRDAKRRAALI